MACLALALQPVKGPDLLLQTREWFPPARAADASSSFRSTRIAYAAGKQISVDVVGTGLGDDALAAASGQVVVGKENKYRVVYRLVNTVYVLGVTSAHQDDSANNIFECANVVNQTVLEELRRKALKRAGLTEDELLRQIHDRAAARASKDFGKSDEIRDKLSSLGISLMDGGGDETLWRPSVTSEECF